MRYFALCLLLSATSVATLAQTASKPAAPRPTAHTAPASVATKLPPGIPPVHGIVKTAFSLRYQDIKIGTGKEAEPNKMYKVAYTGWLAATGHKFDSSYDHKTPVMGKDGKPEMDADGKPKMNAGDPISFPQGFGRVIPGFDQGFDGMKIGGKRRLFIPWQLAYGAPGRPGPNADNPGIPPKADLIFDAELIDVSDMQMPQGHPGMMNGPNGQPMHMMPHPAAPGTTPPSQPTTPPTTVNPNPAAPPPAGTPPPATTPTTPPPDKPQAE